MTHPFFCADVARQVGEDLIGSAAPARTFVLIEWPFPWKPEAFESNGIPQNLRELIAAAKSSRAGMRFLLVNRSGRSTRTVAPTRRVILYQQETQGFCGGYQRWEWQVEDLKEIAPLIQSHSWLRVPAATASGPPLRDLLVCVHGSHDKCCAKYGLPFCQQAHPVIEAIEGQSIRLWHTSHIGGHRFAPTLIDLPNGRYYGRMNPIALQAILTRSGEVEIFNEVYRGWSILPSELQAAERALIQRYGWPGLDYRIAYRIDKGSPNSSVIKAQLSVLRSDGWVDSYAVELVKDSCKTTCLKTSCRAVRESEKVHYAVKSLHCFNSTPWQDYRSSKTGAS